MRIGLVSPYDWSYPGGVQDHIAHLATELRSRGHNVRILTPATGARARQVEYGIYRLGWTAPLYMNGSVARVAVAPDMRGRIRGLLERERFDVLHLHEPLASAIPLTVLHLAHVTNAVYVGTFHAYAKRSLRSTSEWAYVSARAFLGGYIRRLDGRIAVSEPAREFVSRFFPGDYRVIPNGVDINRFNPQVAPLPRYMDGKLNILYFGRMEQRKGPKFLIRAIPLIREHFPNTRFIFAGEGKLRPAFEAFVERRGWKDVVFTGRVPDSEKAETYASAHIYCAPNTGGESQGITLLEAMACGRPIVASDIPGFRTTVRDRVEGLLVPPKRHEELAWAINYLLGDEAARRRYSAAGPIRAAEFSWQRVGARVEAYYEELCARRQPRIHTFAAPAAAMAAD